jgi:3-deoxy-7-phosphoheptulonate synthase
MGHKLFIVKEQKMLFTTDDLRIDNLKPLIPPAILMEEFPVTDRGSETVTQTRTQIGQCLRGKDDRLVVVVGPCSIHDYKAGLDYAERLKPLYEKFKEELIIVMRVYFEKPRTTVGWKGMINDPDLDGSFQINKGLKMARGLLCRITDMGLPTAVEYLDTISPQFLADLVSWGAIGARTTESQIHRQLASGLSCPIGFKNGTDGNIQIAMDAIRAADYPHHFLSVTKQGLAAIVSTKGNPDGHVILRGGSSGTNYSEQQILQTSAALSKAGVNERIIVDCSHGNSNKDYRNQKVVAQEVAKQVQAGQSPIFGVMLESFIHEGRQDVVPGKDLEYGKSITDACIGWDETIEVLGILAKAVRAKRKL